MHSKARRIIPVVLILLVAALSWFYFSRQVVNAQSGLNTASGTIEATQVILAPEIGGRILDVLAEEGDAVRSGQVLVRFEDSLLQAQLRQAEAALEQAQDNYNLVAAGTPAEQRQAAIAAANVELVNARRALSDLNVNAPLLAASAQEDIARAQDAIDAATTRENNLNTASSQADIDAARAAVTLAKDKLDRAREDYAPYEKKPESNLTRAGLLAKYSDAQKTYDAAVTHLNNLLGHANQIDLALAAADLSQGQALLADAQRRYDIYKNGPDPADVARAQAQIDLAQAHLDAANAVPTKEQLAVAQAQVDTAQAALGVIQAQLEKLVLVAPGDGVVLDRSVEPGEFAAPGAPLLTLARLDNLTLTIYVPEDQYGLIQLGEKARISVDSFPGQVFTGAVVHIADQAEFTPRNVQTEEGRRATVFAVKLAVDNPEGKLKPGMPADVTFGN